jgi:predicted transcriptional regulator of viral defense system
MRSGGDLISVADAANALSIDRAEAAKLLARWQEQSWVRRVRRGLYAPVAITDSRTDTPLEDSWVLVAELFEPGYIGGATAAHHWDLTEQLFRTVFVYTARDVRRVNQQIKGTTFTVRHLAANRIFGTKPLWRGRTKVQISDVHRTIVDVVRNPADGGGLRHVADCFAAYLKRSDCDPMRLIEYAERLGSGALFKRLGFFTEWAGGPRSLAEACLARLTQGVAKLDPALPSPRLVRRWRLWVPNSWKPESAND